MTGGSVRMFCQMRITSRLKPFGGLLRSRSHEQASGVEVDGDSVPRRYKDPLFDKRRSHSMGADQEQAGDNRQYLELFLAKPAKDTCQIHFATGLRSIDHETTKRREYAQKEANHSADA
jgi:hypothetical protein